MVYKLLSRQGSACNVHFQVLPKLILLQRGKFRAPRLVLNIPGERLLRLNDAGSDAQRDQLPTLYDALLQLKLRETQVPRLVLVRLAFERQSLAHITTDDIDIFLFLCFAPARSHSSPLRP